MHSKVQFSAISPPYAGLILDNSPSSGLSLCVVVFVAIVIIKQNVKRDLRTFHRLMGQIFILCTKKKAVRELQNFRTSKSVIMRGFCRLYLYRKGKLTLVLYFHRCSLRSVLQTGCWSVSLCYKGLF